MSPDPRDPTQSEEEVVTDVTGGGQTTRRAVRTPGQRSEEVSTQTTTPTGQTVQRSSYVGPSPTYAREYERKREVFHAYRIVWYILGLIEILLAFRFFLKATGANPASGFAQFIYGFSDVFAGPFAALYRQTRVVGDVGVSVIEWSTILAAIFYLILAWAIVQIIRLYKPTQPEEIEREVEQT